VAREIMIKTIQSLLKRLADIQVNHLPVLITLIIFFTAFTAVGIGHLGLQSDLDKMNPQDVEIIQRANEIDYNFNQLDGIVIVVQLDDKSDSRGLPRDIREPEIMNFLVRLEDNLNNEPSVQNVVSAGLLFQEDGVPETLEDVKDELADVPGSERFFNRGYTLTTVFIKADVGADDELIQAVNERVEQIVRDSSVPGGVKTVVTGDPPLMSAIFNLLISDSLYTLILATIVIYILLLILRRSFVKSFLIIFPLLIGIIWTLGILGWAGIEITIATAGLSAMLLGLGVEYSIFLASRYEEERQDNETRKALSNTLSSVGASITSSGTTTVIGFLALSLSFFPVLSDMGLSLAIGIAMLLLSTILVGPIGILINEKTCEKHKRKSCFESKKGKPVSRIYLWFDSYGALVSKIPTLILIIGLVLTAFMYVSSQSIRLSEIDYDTVLPDNLDAVRAFTILNDEFGETKSASIYIKLSPETQIRDIRDPELIRYVDILTQKTKYLTDFYEVTSISEIVKQNNEGRIPNTLTETKEYLNAEYYPDLINPGSGATLIKITFTDNAKNDEVTRQIKELIENTQAPVGVITLPAGSMVIESDLQAAVAPDSQNTSIIAFVGIILFLLILTRSFKYTILPLVTVILGIIWTLGLIGLLNVPFNNITSSVVTLTIGIGIDFGLQLMIRYRQEREKYDKRKAMRVTLANILEPMLITAIAALIGFRAMSLGQLRMMGDLGTTASFGVAGSMIAAVTVVASLMILFERDKNKKKTKKDDRDYLDYIDVESEEE